jgi:hypothetical protein
MTIQTNLGPLHLITLKKILKAMKFWVNLVIENGLKTEGFFKKNSDKMPFSLEKLMLPSESFPQELSNEWSCQYVSTTLHFWGNFCVPPLVTIRP